MSFFRFYWLRRLIRRNTNPIPQPRAELWRSRLSIIYTLIAWNAFGFVVYQIYSGKSDWAKYYGIKTEEEEKMSPGHRWAKTLGIKDAKVYRVTGFSVEKVEDDEKVESNK
ncbi:unnamed protein product [Psylliodes chrysocephalus]|uniref:Uncharacterized protein n=1 Tax=Psylliodes chrysocephalus TaxID=3402493 RepID=A0A9P0CWR5_9CUCU|nr:unnamed protein product [Psylliodes chrysocephala]